MTGVIYPLIKYFFFGTETQKNGEAVHYYDHLTWNYQLKKTVNQLLKNRFLVPATEFSSLTAPPYEFKVKTKNVNGNLEKKEGFTSIQSDDCKRTRTSSKVQKNSFLSLPYRVKARFIPKVEGMRMIMQNGVMAIISLI
jgi:hypothetical protein